MLANCGGGGKISVMADDDVKGELRSRIADSNEKYTYYLLATASAALAFAVHQTAGVGVSWSQVPLAIAVASWAYSFYCGCKRIQTVLELHNRTADVLEWQLPNPSDLAAVQKVRGERREDTFIHRGHGESNSVLDKAISFSNLRRVLVSCLARRRDGCTDALA